MKRYLFIFFVIASIQNGFGQRKGYIVIGDTALVQGWIEFKFKNPSSVKYYRSRNSWKEYNANQVSEFEFKNGEKYVSNLISIGDTKKNVFLLQVEEGATDLYVLNQKAKDRLFIQNDSLIEIKESNFNEVIKSFTNTNSKWAKQQSLVKLEQQSVAFIVRNHNINQFSNVPFNKFGLKIDYIKLDLDLPINLFNINLTGSKLSSSTIGLGIFFESPIWSVQGLSLVNNFSYVKGALVESTTRSFNTFDIKGKYALLDFEIYPKYTFKYENVRPYLIAGADFKYILNRDIEVYQTTFEGNLISIERINSDVLLFGSYYYGFKYGVGIDIFYRFKNYISLLISGSHTYGNEEGEISDFSISISTNIL